MQEGQSIINTVDVEDKKQEREDGLKDSIDFERDNSLFDNSDVFKSG